MTKFSIKVVEDFVEMVPWSRTIKKAANAELSTRLFPSRTPRNDANLNLRFDKGSGVGDKHELILQANKNASDPGVKAAAAEDSHKVWGKVLVDPEKPDAQKARQDILDSFKATD